MSRLIHKARKKAGLSPGTLVYVGEKRTERPRITLFDYDPDHLEEKTLDSVEDTFAYKDSKPVSWINLDGLHDVELLRQFGERFELHPLVQEDIVHTLQRPKMEDYQDYVFLVFRLLTYDVEQELVSTEQISLVVGPNYVLSFQERQGDVFDPVRNRIRNGKGRIRKLGADYLAYALLDAVVDNYFTVLEQLGEVIEDVEERLMDDPTPKLLQEIHTLKREMILLRKSVWPLREVLGNVMRNETPLIKEQTKVYMRDVYDHTIQVADAVESYRDMLSGLQDLYLSSISNRMNEVMKVLTIIATIFVPLTFVAGIYGMNFEFMPELKWRWSYAVFWTVIVLVGGSMVFYFRRRRWL